MGGKLREEKREREKKKRRKGKRGERGKGFLEFRGAGARTSDAVRTTNLDFRPLRKASYLIKNNSKNQPDATFYDDNQVWSCSPNLDCFG